MQTLLATAIAALFALLPVQCLVLPWNMALVDLGGLLVLPLCWAWLAQERRPLRLPYLPAMLAVLLTTGIASLASRDPMTSFAVVVKELYLYLWLVTFSSVFAHLDERQLRRLLIAWCAAAYLNGALILAQFVYPPLLAAMNANLGGLGGLDPYRPSGLLENSNAAATFQLTAFVPLLAMQLPRRRLLWLASLLMLTLIGTGSMGALLAFTCGLVAGVIGLAVLARDWRPLLKFAIVGSVVLGLLAAVVLVLVQTVPVVQERLQYVLYGRGEGSAEGRFHIWERGLTALMSEMRFWGVGPDIWLRMDGHELHNDLLSFAVERGPLAVLSLLTLIASVIAGMARMVRGSWYRGEPFALVFLAAFVAMLVEAQTHEIFHQRQFWLVLALQEGLHWRGLVAGRARSDAPGLPVGDQRRAAATMLRTEPMT